MRRLRVFTWHVHGSYQRNLLAADVEWILPVKPGRPEGYGGGSFLPEPDLRVREIRVEEVAETELDVVLYQSRKNYEVDQYECLTRKQRELPRVYVEHDPPRDHPTDTLHPVQEPEVLVVHVTEFNRLMWNNGINPTGVIEHGVEIPPGIVYSGEKAKGLVVVNGLESRGRRVGRDIVERVRAEVPLEIVGIESEQLGGRGEVRQGELPALMARYRFMFNPLRYTSLGLTVCEAMMVGLPIVGLATTEMPMVIQNGVSGYVDTSVERVVVWMKRLLAEPRLAAEMSKQVRSYAQRKFGLERFGKEWRDLFETVVAEQQQVNSISLSRSEEVWL